MSVPQSGQQPVMIHLSNLSKHYGQHVALRDLTLDVPAGITGLLGPNGAGKSTLIKLLLGLVRITRGEGTILGYPLGQQRNELLSRVGYVPEDDCYIPGLSGVEAVQLAARLSRIPSREALRRAHEMLDFCGMGQERYRTVETYSTGMRQKLKFAAALVHDPELLILDEPTAGLDPDERMGMLRRIRRLADHSGKSTLLCTHILPDIESISDYVVILAKGTMRLSQSMADLRKPATPQVVVQIVGDAERFGAHLRHLGVSAEPLSASRYLLHGDVEALSGRVWQWAAECGTTLTRVIPAQTPLQQVFLSAVAENSHAAQ